MKQITLEQQQQQQTETITTAKMELLVALVRSFQLLSNLSNEYYNIF